jgi:hypothetical protein
MVEEGEEGEEEEGEGRRERMELYVGMREASEAEWKYSMEEPETTRATV